ncbi:MAG: type II toxin-antitoxin system Phd/YefM family antitoxin [Thermodesulfovibrio sp.]|nr:type II toxin-antitoxin system Phd/YefM family antitoxin [Thermodesulfovibrio sp.]
MKTYTYSQARQRLADLLEESKKEEVLIRRRKGDVFSIVPKNSIRRSPFDVPSLGKKIPREEILNAIYDSRQRQ